MGLLDTPFRDPDPITEDYIKSLGFDFLICFSTGIKYWVNHESPGSLFIRFEHEKYELFSNKCQKSFIPENVEELLLSIETIKNIIKNE